MRGAWEQAGETPPWGRAPLSLAAKVICDPPLTSTITLVKLKNAGLSEIGQHFFQYFSIPKPEPR